MTKTCPNVYHDMLNVGMAAMGPQCSWRTFTGSMFVTSENWKMKEPWWCVIYMKATVARQKDISALRHLQSFPDGLHRQTFLLLPWVQSETWRNKALWKYLFYLRGATRQCNFGTKQMRSLSSVFKPHCRPQKSTNPEPWPFKCTHRLLSLALPLKSFLVFLLFL